MIGSANAVINLAGAPIIGRRWSDARKAAIRNSRVHATTTLARAVASAARPPVLINGSAIGFYGAHDDEPLTENSPRGSDFLADVVADWERAALEAAPATRVVLLRTGLVLSRDGGALPQFARPFLFGVGGRIGSGEQYVSWIHRDDWIAMIEWALAHATIAGPLNATAPNPVTNATLAKEIARVLRRPALVPAPAFAMRLLLGEMSDTILTGQRVLPARAEAAGFAFRYPVLDGALRSLYAKR